MGVTRLKILLHLITFSCVVVKISADGPNITMLFDYQFRSKYTCIASGYETISEAQTFITSLSDEKVSNLNDFVIKNRNIENYNCDFETYCNWKDEKLRRNSKNYNFYPVLDDRWNKFKIFRTKGSNVQQFQIENNFHVSVSVRAQKDAQIILCYNRWISSTSCYWILIDAFQENRITAIRKCVKGVPDNFPKNNECRMHRNNITLPEKILDENHWRHFTITRENSNRILLWEFSYSDKPLLNYTDYTDPISISSISFRSYLNTIVEWKMHDYNFIEIPKEKKNSQIIFGPNMYLNSVTESCFSMYVALCEQCIMELTLEINGKETLSTTIIEGTKDLFIKWKRIQIITDNRYPSYYRQFYVKINTKQDAYVETPFWLIDDFRLCSSKDIKVGFIDLNEPDSRISCESLQYPQWRFSNGSYDPNAEILQCTDPKYIGKYCDITCNDINKSKYYCNNQKICVPTKSNYDLCTCASGYSGTDCNTLCTSGYYGYNCNKKCGKCNFDTCQPNVGECNQCHEGFVEPFCNTTFYPRLLEAPTIINTSYNIIKIKLMNITTDGLENATSFQIQYRKQSEKNWLNYGINETLYLNVEMELTNLEKETSYLIRVILFTINGNTFIYNEDDEFGIPRVIASTKCDEAITMNLRPGIRNVSISFDETNFSCALSNYNLTINTNGKIINHFEYINNKDEQFLRLKPFTNYEIIATYKLFPFNKIRQIFTTLEDAPSIVNNINSKIISDTEVLITWEQPKVPNGIINFYIIEYKHIKYISCSSYSNDNSQVTQVSAQNMQLTLNNLKPYSNYYIAIAGETIFRGTYNNISFNTISSSISNDELPDSKLIVITPFSTLVNIGWKLPNCENIKGSLSYLITITCENTDWCNYFQYQQKIIDSRSNSVAFTSLIPFTNYKIELRAVRSDSNETSINSVINEFYTSPGVPRKVRNLTIYSKDDTSISVKWLPPYPPNGELDYYESKYCYYNFAGYCTLSKSSIISNIPCDFWEENNICFQLNNLYSNLRYKIYIAAKNKNVVELSAMNEVSGITVEGEPSKPLNLCSKWDNDKLILYWNHPDISNGLIRHFYITLTLKETDLEQNDIKVVHQKFVVANTMKTYTKEFKKTFPYSSSYEVTVNAYTKIKGKPATLFINTPPETPELSADIKLKQNAVTNTSVKIEIPPVIKTSKSKHSTMFIVVSKLDSRAKRNVQIEPNSKDLEQMILERGSATTDSWIAVEIALNDNKVDIEIGDGRIAKSYLLNKTIDNRYLEPDTKYAICIVLMNQYRSARSFNKYELDNVRTTETNVPSSGVLYALLLLLLVPLIIYFVFRRYYSKDVSSPGIRMPVLNSMSRQENNHDPDIIPLTTEETSDSSRNNISSQPRNSKTKKTPSEISNSATTFFHSRLIPLNNYEEYLKEAIENGELADQHALFRRGQTKPWNYGMIKENKFKNRYNNLIAYDKNRVKLQKISDDIYSDYINASYIHGYKQENAYIATQGPKLTTVNDFWRMIWQEKVQYIVMLANVVEAGKKKCEKYWPDIDSSREYGSVNVYFQKSEIYADYEYRTFIVTNNEEKRTVIQLHFTSWPDHGVPLYPQSLVPFLKKILTIPQTNAPIVVHCSAGVGRTGTIILCDICLRMAAREGQVDILRFLHEIREQRANMVDNIDQYKLVHMVLLECLLAPDTNIPCNSNLSTTIQSLIEDGGLQIQLNNLQNTSWQDKALNFSTTVEQNPLNSSKNRFADIVPVANQIYLPRFPLTDETSDYINAIPVDGFRFKEQFIVTQTPMPNTLVDFWRMIAEKSIKIIVCLNNIPLDDPTCCIFWPNGDEEMKPTPNLTLKYNKLQSYDNYDIHNISFENEETEEHDRIIQIVQFKNWNHNSQLPDNIENLVTLLEETENLSRGNYPMVVSCYDGATACGVFVALSFVIEKIKLEQQCDPCLAVRVIRRNRKQFIKNKIQFECLYKSAIIYLNLFETYSNFDLLNLHSPKV